MFIFLKSEKGKQSRFTWNNKQERNAAPPFWEGYQKQKNIQLSSVFIFAHFRSAL